MTCENWSLFLTNSADAPTPPGTSDTSVWSDACHHSTEPAPPRFACSGGSQRAALRRQRTPRFATTAQTRIAELSEDDQTQGLSAAVRTRGAGTPSRTNLDVNLLAILRQRHVFVHVSLVFLDLVQDRPHLHLAGSQSWTFVSNWIMIDPRGEKGRSPPRLLNPSEAFNDPFYPQIRVKNRNTGTAGRWSGIVNRRRSFDNA